MNRIEELVDRLCPDGVPYRKLGEVGTVSRGGSLQKKDFTETGFPCIHYGQIYTRYGLFADRTFSFVSDECAKKQRKAVKNDIIMAVTSENLEDVCKCVVWLGDEEIAVSGHTAIIHHNQDAKYLAYYFNTAAFFDQKRKIAHGTKVIEVTPDRLLDIPIPVPPLEVQREVVRILDEFTTLLSLLGEELTARRKQYAYYRDCLLTFDARGGARLPPAIAQMVARLCPDGVPYRQLGEVFEIRNGYTPSKANSAYWTDGTVPWFRMDDLRANGRILSDSILHVTPQAVKGGRLFPAQSIIMATSATIGEHALITVDSLANQRFTYFTRREPFEAQLNMKFAFYYFFKVGEWCKSNTNIGNFASVDMGKLNRVEIPLPPPEVQREVVRILDKFSTLATSLTSGLPAEIAARRKQYEYYRDKLLSFPRRER